MKKFQTVLNSCQGQKPDTQARVKELFHGGGGV